MPRSPEDVPSKAARHVDLDNAITHPPPPGSTPRTPPRHVDLDNAITHPPPPGSTPRTPPRHVDLDNAITHPPMLTLQPHKGLPPAGFDETRAIRAMLDSLERPDAPAAELAAASAHQVAHGTGAQATASAPGAGSVTASAHAPQASLDDQAPVTHATDLVDSASTQPSMPSARNLVDSAATQPSMSSAALTDMTDALDTTTTEPSLPSAPELVTSAETPTLDSTVAPPPPAARPAALPADTRRPGAQPPRTSGLADDARQPRNIETLRGQGDADALTAIRRGTPTADPRPISRLAALQAADEARLTAARAATKLRDDAARATAEQPAATELDAGVTESIAADPGGGRPAPRRRAAARRAGR